MTLKGSFVVREWQQAIIFNTTCGYHLESTGADHIAYRGFMQQATDEHYGPGYTYSYVPPFDHSVSCWDELLGETFTKPVPIFEYLECKNSRNTPFWGSPEVVDVSVIEAWHQQHEMRRPKKPVFFPLRIRKPYKPIQPIKQTIRPLYRRRHKDESIDSYLAYMAKIELKCSRLSKRRYDSAMLKYKLKLAKYERKLANISSRRTEHYAIFERRMEKWKVRQKRWAILEEKSKDFSFKRRKQKGSGFQYDNPYGFIALTPISDMPLIWSYSWDKQKPAALDDPYLPPDYYTAFEHMHRIHWMAHWVTQSTNMPPADFDSMMLDGRMLDRLEATRKIILDIARKQLESDDDYLVRKIYSKIANKKVHIGNMLAERHQTWSLLKESIQRLRALINLKKKVLQTSLHAVKDPNWLSGEFLKFKFGAEPLANDIIELSKLVNDEGKELGPIVAVRSNVKRHLSFDIDGVQFDGRVTMSRVYKFTTRDTAIANIQSLGLINPAEVAWEVTPWSFVIDWFLPVGAWIESHTAALGMQFLTGTHKIKLEGNFSIKRVPAQFVNGTLTRDTINSIAGDFVGTVIGRTVETSLPDPNRIIRIKNPWSIAHGLETLALLIQRLR